MSVSATTTCFDEDENHGLIVSMAEEMNPSRRCTMEDVCIHYGPEFFRINGRGPSLPSSPKKKRSRSSFEAHADVGMRFKQQNWHMLGVYDGHGGRDIVEYLEHNLGRIVKEELHSDDEDDQNSSVLERMERALLLADVDSYQKGIHASGATVVISLICLDPILRKDRDAVCRRRCRIFTANCGDARAVLSRGRNDSTRISFDHKADDTKEIQRIEDAGGFVLKGRVLGVLAVARSMGDHLLKEYVTARPFLHETQIEYEVPYPDFCDNDRPQPFIILACDGLWDVVSDDEAVSMVQHCISTFEQKSSRGKSKQDLSKIRQIANAASKILTKEGLKRGSTDNISVVVALFR